MVAGDVHHVGEDGPGMGLLVEIAQAELLRQDRAKAARVHHIVGPIAIAFRGGDLHAVVADLHILDRRVLQHGRAVGDRGRHHEIVGVLAVEVKLMAVGLFGDDGLERLPGILGEALLVIEIAEVPLDAVGRARVGEIVFRTEIGQFRHII